MTDDTLTLDVEVDLDTDLDALKERFEDETLMLRRQFICSRCGTVRSCNSTLAVERYLGDGGPYDYDPTAYATTDDGLGHDVVMRKACPCGCDKANVDEFVIKRRT